MRLTEEWYKELEEAEHFNEEYSPKLGALYFILYSASGRCYDESMSELYYDSSLPEALGKQCGVCYKEGYFGGAQKNDTTFIKEIPAEVKALGLDKGEYTGYALDSGD